MVFRGAVALALTVALAGCSLPSDGPLTRTIDTVDSPNHPKPPYLVVDIDEASLDALGQWPWPRSQLAEMVNVLASNGAAAIGFDVAFPENDRTSPSRSLETLRELGAEISFPHGAPELDNDVFFAEALQQAPAVIGFALAGDFVSKIPEPKTGWAWLGPDPRDVLQKYHGSMDVLPLIEEAAQGLGFFNFPHTFDGVVRKVPIIAELSVSGLVVEKLWPLRIWPRISWPSMTTLSILSCFT